MSSKYAFQVSSHEHFYKYPEEYYVKPFRIFANLYFVGNKDVGSYLFDTEEGLILIDTTYPTSRAQMVQSIWEAGFDPRNIRYILHTHGHFDHFGTTKFLQSLSGAKTFLGAEDAKMFRTRPELALIADSRHAFLDLFEPDVLLEDGDVIQLGSTKIRAVSTPGHTMGVISYFAELTEQGETHLAGLYGGIGLNTLCRDSIVKFGTEAWREHYIASLRKVRKEPVDLVLGNHTGQNHTLEKYAQMQKEPKAPNPFIRPKEWLEFLDGAEARYLHMLAEEQAGTDQMEGA